MGDKLSQMQPGSKVHNVLNISDVSITVYQLKETGLRTVIEVKVQIISAAKSACEACRFCSEFSNLHCRDYSYSKGLQSCLGMTRIIHNILGKL